MPSSAPSLECPSGSMEGRVENIGERGLFFATADLEVDVDEGAEVRLSLPCTKDGASLVIERTGSVVRTERYFDGETIVRAFAIRFHQFVALAGLEFA